MNQEVVGIVKYAIGILQMLGISVAVLVLAILGVKWFLGNPQEKANMKVKLTSYILGMFLLVCGPLIVNIAVETITILTGDPGAVYVATRNFSELTGNGSAKIFAISDEEEGYLDEFKGEETGEYAGPTINDASFGQYIVANGSGVALNSDTELESGITEQLIEKGKIKYEFQFLSTFKDTSPSYSISEENGSYIKPSEKLYIKVKTDSNRTVDYILWQWNDGKACQYKNANDAYILAPAKAGTHKLKIAVKDSEGYFTNGEKEFYTETLTYVVEGSEIPPSFSISPNSEEIKPGEHLNVAVITAAGTKLDFIKWKWDSETIKKCSGQKKGYISAPTKEGVHILYIEVKDSSDIYQNGTTNPSWITMTYNVTKTESATKAEKVVSLFKSIHDLKYTVGAEKITSDENGGYTGEADCSGVVRWVFKNATNINLPHSSASQANEGTRIYKRDLNISDATKDVKNNLLPLLEKGDLLFFTGDSGTTYTGKQSIGHVQVYIGNGKMIGQGSDGGPTISTVEYKANRFIEARRIIK